MDYLKILSELKNVIVDAKAAAADGRITAAEVIAICKDIHTMNGDLLSLVESVVVK